MGLREPVVLGDIRAGARGVPRAALGVPGLRDRLAALPSRPMDALLVRQDRLRLRLRRMVLRRRVASGPVLRSHPALQLGRALSSLTPSIDAAGDADSVEGDTIAVSSNPCRV